MGALGWFGLLFMGALVAGAIFLSPIFWYVIGIIVVLILVGEIIEGLNQTPKTEDGFPKPTPGSTAERYDYNDGGGGP